MPGLHDVPGDRNEMGICLVWLARCLPRAQEEVEDPGLGGPEAGGRCLTPGLCGQGAARYPRRGTPRNGVRVAACGGTCGTQPRSGRARARPLTLTWTDRAQAAWIGSAWIGSREPNLREPRPREPQPGSDRPQPGSDRPRRTPTWVGSAPGGGLQPGSDRPAPRRTSTWVGSAPRRRTPTWVGSAPPVRPKAPPPAAAHEPARPSASATPAGQAAAAGRPDAITSTPLTARLTRRRVGPRRRRRSDRRPGAAVPSPGSLARAERGWRRMQHPPAA
jgi:hypothetical protein